MNTIERIQNEVEGARKQLKELLALPREQRTPDYAAKRDAITAELEGLTNDYKAAQLSDLDSEGKAQTEEIHAKFAKVGTNRIEVESKGSNVGGLDYKGIRESGRKNGRIEVDFDLKQLFGASRKSTTTRTGMGVANSYDDLYLKPVRPPQILDFLPSAQTTLPSVNYRRGTALTGAANRLEGQALAEVTQTATQVSDPIQSIGLVMHVSMEEIEDDAQFQLVLDAMIRDTERQIDSQVMIGTGTSPNLRGITTTASPQTEAYATSVLQTIINAKSKLRTTERAMPNLLAFNPQDWASLSGSIITSAYSAITYVNNGLLPLLTGTPVIEHEDLTVGVGVVLDPEMYNVIYRQGIVMESTNSNGVMFTDLTESYRAYARLALKTRRLGARLIDLTA